MSVSRHCIPYAAAVFAAALCVFGWSGLAATGATMNEAVAMVKKAVVFIQTEGGANAYPEISDPRGRFVDRDLYIVVYGLDGMVLAHGADAKRVGTNQIGDTDPDGKAFVKERVELAATQPSFWQSYKFRNPVTNTVEPKEMYCGRLDQTVVCGGVYQL
jgi:signal transduction histidine kinase